MSLFSYLIAYLGDLLEAIAAILKASSVQNVL